MKNRAGKGKDNVMAGERMRPLRGLSTFGQRRRKASLSSGAGLGASDRRGLFKAEGRAFSSRVAIQPVQAASR